MQSLTPLRPLRREGADAGVKKAIEMVITESKGKEERGIEERRGEIEKYTDTETLQQHTISISSNDYSRPLQIIVDLYR